MPRFNRERRVIDLLKSGRAVLLFRSWDTPGVLPAGAMFAEALERPAMLHWDPRPPDPGHWRFLIESRSHVHSIGTTQST